MQLDLFKINENINKIILATKAKKIIEKYLYIISVTNLKRMPIKKVAINVF